MRTQAQEDFKRKLMGFGVLLIFVMFAVVGLGVVKSIAQTHSQAEEVLTTEESTSANPDVTKFAFLAAAIAVGVALFTGVLAYAAIFTWVGLITSRALAFGLIYVFLWEGLLSSFLGGVRYFSVRAYTLAILHGMDENHFEALGERVIEFPAAIAGAIAVTVVFFLLAVRRLRGMDVP